MAIVCGTDFSPAAAQAASVAASIAARRGEPLLLVYSLDELADFRVDPQAGRAYESAIDLARQRLPVEAARLRGLGATVTESLVTGAVDQALAHQAEKADARLIVVASTGRRGASRLLLGSVAERTLRSSPVPVLVVRAADSLEAWIRGERPLRLVVGTDLSAASELGIRWAAALRRMGPCRVTVVHVTRPGAGDPDALHGDLRRHVEDAGGDADIDVSVRVEAGSTGAGLARIAAAEQADLLVVGSRQRTGLDRFWHGTVAGEALSNATMNLACVPALGPEARRAEPIRPMRTILAATDFSKLGNAAVPHAYSLVAGDGTIHLVHVLQAPRFHSAATPHAADLAFTLETASGHHLAARLASLVPDAAQLRGITTQLNIIEHRDVAEGICDAAVRLGADAICMGTHGGSWIAEAIVGSVAHGVARRTPVPLVLIPPPRDV